MALAIDAISSAHGTGSSLTFAHTCTGLNRLLVVWVSYFDSADAPTGATYNGVAMTAIPSSTAANGNYKIAGFYLIAPATGPNNIVVSFSGAMSDMGAGAVSFTDAHQTTPLGTAVTATGTNTTPSVTVTTSAGEIVVDGLVIVHGGTLTVDGSQTQRWNSIASNGFQKYAGSTETASGASTPMGWNNSSSQQWAIGAVPIKPVSAGGGTVAAKMSAYMRRRAA